MEDEILNICRLFRWITKINRKILLRLLSKIVEELSERKLEKSPSPILILRDFSGYYWFNNCICHDLVDNFFFSTACWNWSNKEKFREKIEGADPELQKILK